MIKQLKQAVVLFILPIICVSCSGKKTKTAVYEFTNIRRGNLERAVSSSGTINPVAAVKVLPRMSGKGQAERRVFAKASPEQSGNFAAYDGICASRSAGTARRQTTSGAGKSERSAA